MPKGHTLRPDAPCGVVWKQEDWLRDQDRESREAGREVFTPRWRRALPMLPFRTPFAQPRARIPRWRCPPPAFCVSLERFAVLFEKHCCSRKSRHALRRISRLSNTLLSRCAWREHGLGAAAAAYCAPRSDSKGERPALLRVSKKCLNVKCEGLRNDMGAPHMNEIPKQSMRPLTRGPSLYVALVATAGFRR
jgi:hypothetical protein